MYSLRALELSVVHVSFSYIVLADKIKLFLAHSLYIVFIVFDICQTRRLKNVVFGSVMKHLFECLM